jgi:hypothetical protein
VTPGGPALGVALGRAAMAMASGPAMIET